MDIYEALATDHAKVKQLLNQLVNLNEENSEVRHQLISHIRDELIPHSRAEEAVLYNSLRMMDASKSLAMHGYAEHMMAEGLLRSLQVMDKLDTTWKTIAKKLRDALEHHIREEESEMFSAGRKLFTEDEAVSMAETFNALKPEIKGEGIVKTTLDMVANLMPPRLTEKFKNFDITQRQ